MRISYDDKKLYSFVTDEKVNKYMHQNPSIYVQLQLHWLLQHTLQAVLPTIYAPKSTNIPPILNFPNTPYNQYIILQHLIMHAQKP